MASTQKTRIELADEALARYYKLCKVEYYDGDGNGKFMTWDAEGIDEEFEVDADESQFYEMDDMFPSINGSSNKLTINEIVEVLRDCWINPESAYTNDPIYSFEITPDDWNISKEDITSITKILKKQCKKIFDSGFQEDKSILKLLCVGQKINKPYLQFICDSYSRDRVEAAFNGQKPVIPNIWTQTNIHCKKLRDLKILNDNSSNTPLDDTEGAIKSFFHRISSQLMLQPPQKINDSLSQTCHQISAAIDFVYSLVNNQNGQNLSCPFQFDCTFAFNGVVEGQIMVDFTDDEDEDSEDDTDDDSDEDESNDDVKKQFIDYFGNIKDRLNHENLLFLNARINDDDNKESGSTKQARIFKEQFKKFKTDKIKNDDFPQKNRFCAIVDRRNGNKENDILDDDELIIYLPPKNCQKFPEEQHHPMFYFGTTRTSILPNKGYNAGDNPFDDVTHKNAKKINNKTKKPTETNITSQIGCNGASLILSFHVESIDEIRCYIYLNGQILRFLPHDIIKVLPRFFDSKFGDNATFPQSEEAKLLIAEMEKKLIDQHFMAFYNAYKSSV